MKMKILFGVVVVVKEGVLAAVRSAVDGAVEDAAAVCSAVEDTVAGHGAAGGVAAVRATSEVVR